MQACHTGKRSQVWPESAQDRVSCRAQPKDWAQWSLFIVAIQVPTHPSNFDSAFQSSY